MIRFNLNNRVAIITGGAQGFGFAITERFISSGAKVIIWDIDENECKKAISKINSKNFTFQIMLHGAVVGRRKHKTQPYALDTLRDLRGRQIKADAQSFQYIRRAAATRDRAIAVLGHARTCRCRDKGGSRGNVEQVSAIAPGANQIDQMVVLNLDRRHQFAHHLGRTGDLVDGLPLHAQGYQHRTNLCWGRFAGHDGHHDLAHGSAGEILTRHELRERRLKVHRPLPV